MGKKIGRGAVILLGTMAAGFLIGRVGLGEGYLRHTLAAIQRPEARAVPRPTSPSGEGIPEISPDIPPLPGDESLAPSAPEGQASSPETAGEGPAARPPEEAEKEAIFVGRFSLQLGSFEREDKANKMAEAVTGLGYPARVEAQEGEGEKVYRVLVGSYASEDSARRMAEELRQKGFDAFVTQQ